MTITTWKQVDSALKTMAEVDAAEESASGARDKAINRAQEKYEKAMRTSLDKRVRLANEVETFCREHSADFEERRIHDRPFGSVGFRLGPVKLSVLAKTGWDGALALAKDVLSRAQRKTCVRVKEDFDKRVLATLPDDTLAKLGVSKGREHGFQLKVFPERLKGR